MPHSTSILTALRADAHGEHHRPCSAMTAVALCCAVVVLLVSAGAVNGGTGVECCDALIAMALVSIAAGGALTFRPLMAAPGFGRRWLPLAAETGVKRRPSSENTGHNLSKYRDNRGEHRSLSNFHYREFFSLSPFSPMPALPLTTIPTPAFFLAQKC